ncbi:zinc finger MYM-type protein 6-like [Cotesia glomerata]|nr:zinc finger MYM-type protein 6-like [Cotesia glomerata]
MDSSEPSAKKSKKSKSFQHQWYDDNPEWRTWVKECLSDSEKFLCVICNENLACGRFEIDRHSKTKKHLGNLRVYSFKNSSFPNVVLPEISSSVCSQLDSSSSLSSSELQFNERVKAAEIQFATLIAQNNIPLSTAPQILKLFQSIGKEPAVLQKMTVGKTKATGIITNVVSVRESERIVENVQKTKFSIQVDETTDITNDKWMTLMVRYVDPNTLTVNNELLKLLHLDGTDGSAKRLFEQFCDALARLGIPLEQIIGLACDNASVMVGKNNSFKILMTQQIPNLRTLPCICHSLALASKEACSKIPVEVHDFVANIISYINNSPKRSAIFAEFQECYEENLLSRLFDSLVHDGCLVKLRLQGF